MQYFCYPGVIQAALTHWLAKALPRSAIAAQLVPLILIGTGSGCTLWDHISAGWQAQVWASTICTSTQSLHTQTWRCTHTEHTWIQGQRSRQAQTQRHKTHTSSHMLSYACDKHTEGTKKKYFKSFFLWFRHGIPIPTKFQWLNT